MNLTQLHALSSLDGRYLNRVSSLRTHFSEFSLIKYRVIVEIEYLIFLLAQTKLVSLSNQEISALRLIVSNFSDADAVTVKELEATYHHDVKAVEYFLQQAVTAKKLEKVIPYIHFGLTSEDINSCAYGIALKEANKQVLIPAIKKAILAILNLADSSAASVMMARTHGQPAVPTTLGKELLVFASRLEKILQALRAIQIEAKLSGAVGNWNAQVFALPEQDWQSFSEEFITSLGLKPNLLTTQVITGDSYAEFFQVLVRLNSVTIDCARDCWQYISDDYLHQQVSEQHVGSSTMPQKVNPIDFENSEGNAGMAIAVLQHFVEKVPISRLQRDLSDSTVKRSFGSALGYTLLAIDSLTTGFKKVSPNTEKMKRTVTQHPDVLAEALQTALRLSGSSDAYDVIKTLTRGKNISLEELHNSADLIQDTKTRERFIGLRPQDYSGLAEALVHSETVRITKSLEQDTRLSTNKKGLHAKS